MHSYVHPVPARTYIGASQCSFAPSQDSAPAALAVCVSHSAAAAPHSRTIARGSLLLSFAVPRPKFSHGRLPSAVLQHIVTRPSTLQLHPPASNSTGANGGLGASSNCACICPGVWQRLASSPTMCSSLTPHPGPANAAALRRHLHSSCERTARSMPMLFPAHTLRLVASPAILPGRVARRNLPGLIAFRVAPPKRIPPGPRPRPAQPESGSREQRQRLSSRSRRPIPITITATQRPDAHTRARCHHLHSPSPRRVRRVVCACFCRLFL